MPKRPTASASQLKPDPKYHSILASKFINCMMWQGKKSVAQRIFYDALGVLDNRVSEVTEIDVFTQAVENVKPMIEVRSKRVGGATYQVPIEIKPERRLALAHRWLISAARSRNGKTISDNLSSEFIDASKGTGSAIRMSLIHI